MIIVRDFSTQQQKWVYWKTSNTKDAYQDYPPNVGLPPISSLLGSLQVIRVVDNTQNSQAIPESSAWEMSGTDLFPVYKIDGHTGKWAVRIAQQELKSAIGITTDGLSISIAENSFYSFSTDSEGNIVSSEVSDGSVVGFELDDGIVFKTSQEYDIDEVSQNLTSSSSLPSKFVDIIPGETNMPDKFWKKYINDLIPI